MGQIGQLILLSPKVITLCLKVGLKHTACEEELYFWLHLNTQIIPLA